MGELIHDIGYWIHDFGVWGYPLAVGLMAFVAVLPIPAEIPAAMNGMLFGPVGTGGGTVKLCPPLCISGEQLGEGLDVLEEAFDAVCGE